jgi:hypothetical protein
MKLYEDMQDEGVKIIEENMKWIENQHTNTG